VQVISRVVADGVFSDIVIVQPVASLLRFRK